MSTGSRAQVDKGGWQTRGVISFSTLDELRRRESAKWTLYDPDVLPMPVAEMDVNLADPVAAALHDAIARSDVGYPGVGGRLEEAFAAFAGERWGWTIDPAQVGVAVDVGGAAKGALAKALQPGDAVVIDSPVYPPFHAWPGQVGLELVDVPLTPVDPDDPGRGGRLDLPAIEAAYAAGARAHLLCHPHNPLGRLHGRDELAALAELAARYDVLVVSDEIHAPLALPGQDFVPFLSVSDAARAHGVALHSASKAWNLAGLKAAVAVTGHPRTAQLLAPVRDDLRWHAGHLGVIGGSAAYAHGAAWLDELLVVLAGNHARLRDGLAARLPGARVVPAQAGYLAWVDARDLRWGEEPADAALLHGRVALGEGSRFGSPGRGHVRVNVGCAPELVDEAVERLARTQEILAAG